MAAVERAWFRAGFGRENAGPIFWSEERPDGDFDDAIAADAESDLATYQREVEMARETVAGHSLDETFRWRSRDQDVSLRSVYLHMIEEYARHNGHADLIRERIDGATGQ